MKTSMLRMVLSLTLIAAIVGALLGLVHSITLSPIEQAQARAKTEALAEILPAFDNDPDAASYTLTLPGDKKAVTIYPATLGGEPSGTAVETWTADGFSGDITMMVGFDPAGKVTGYKILSHAETPGLGAKADTWFRDPAGHRSVIGTTTPLVVSKDAAPQTDTSTGATTGATVKKVEQAQPIDGITAATITSRAFLDAVNRARKAIETNE